MKLLTVWKLSTDNELVINANNTSTDQVVIGNTADNYTGSGFKYIFKDGKGNNADVYAKNYYGDFKGKISYSTDIGSFTNKTVGDFKSALFTYLRTLNDNGVYTFYWSGAISILYAYTNDSTTFFADSRIFCTVIKYNDRFIIKMNDYHYYGFVMHIINYNEIVYFGREYFEGDIVTTKDTSTVTGTLNVPTQVATDNSDKVASTAFVQAAIAAALKAKGL